MGIGKRIKEARENLNYTQEELAMKIGVTKGAIANYENEVSQDMFEEKKDKLLAITEINLIDKYRILNPHGKKTVDTVLNIEYENSLKEKNTNSSEDTITLPIVARGGKAKPVTLSKKQYEEANKKHQDLFNDNDTSIIPLDED